MFIGHAARVNLAEVMYTASRGNPHQCKMVLWDVNVIGIFFHVSQFSL